MSQLSRPYQIAVCAMLVLGLVWIVALRAHGPNPNQPAPAGPAKSASAHASAPVVHASAPVVSAAAEARQAAAPTPIYHGPAPGLEGLTRAIAKAHGAVALSQRNAAQLQANSAHASNEAPPAGSGAPTGNTVPTASAAHGTVTVARSTKKTLAPSASHPQTGSGVAKGAPAKGGHPAQQVAVEQELAHGQTVILMFWNPQSAVDSSVRAQVNVLARRSKGAIAVHMALAGQVGTFGSITEVAHVYQTPTVLIVNRHGVVSTLTGLTDVFALEQAVREAKSASA